MKKAMNIYNTDEAKRLFDELPLQILMARNRLKGRLLETPLMYSASLSSMAEGAKVYIKLESEQSTGSCKARGAFNKIYNLAEMDKELSEKGLVVISSGNYALACLELCNELKIPLTIICFESVSLNKRKALMEKGGNLIMYGKCLDKKSRTKAVEIANETGAYFLSPCDDVDVIVGMGTIGLEVLEELPDVDYVLVAVGGGGMISGIASYIKHMKHSTKIVGCSPQRSKPMYQCVKAGKIIHTEIYETVSDGTNVDVAENSVTFPLCRDYVDEWILVEEEQIERAILFMLQTNHKIVEGAAGTAIGAYMSNPSKFIGKTVVIVSCGSNISVTTLQNIIKKHAD